MYTKISEEVRRTLGSVERFLLISLIGYADQGQSNITLAWMMAQVQPFIDFDVDYILDQYDETEKYYKDTGQKVRPWSFGMFL